TGDQYQPGVGRRHSLRDPGEAEFGERSTARLDATQDETHRAPLPECGHAKAAQLLAAVCEVGGAVYGKVFCCLLVEEGLGVLLGVVGAKRIELLETTQLALGAN